MLGRNGFDQEAVANEIILKGERHMKRSVLSKGLFAAVVASALFALGTGTAEAGGRRSHHGSHHRSSYHSRPVYNHHGYGYSGSYAPRSYAPSYYAPSYYSYSVSRPVYYPAPVYSYGGCNASAGYSSGYGY